MKQSNLDQKELNRRADQVFALMPGDYIFDVFVEDDGRVRVNMQELGEDGDYVNFNYEPDMTDRPEALAYLMGERDDFND